MESIFKALSKEYNSVKDIQDASLENKQDLLNELVEYVNSMDWLTRVKTKERISFFIKSGYDYEALCKEFSLSYVSAKNAVKWASKQLRKKIGVDTIQLIRSGFIEEARVAFYVGSGKISRENLFLSEMVDILPESKFSAAYTLQDCLSELVYLRKISLNYIGLSINVVQQMLGDCTSNVVTKIYNHMTQEQSLEACSDYYAERDKKDLEIHN